MSQFSLGSASVGGSGSFGSGFSIDDIIKRFIKDSDAAKAASLAQLDQLMNTIKALGIQVGGTFDDALGSIASAGEAASGEAVRRGQQTLAAGRQDLISSGLSNTTLGPNLRRAVAGDVGREQQRIQEGVGAQRADLLTRRAGQETQIGGMLANAIQSVNNIGPDIGQFAALIQAASQASNPNKKVTASIGPGSVGGAAGQPRSSGSFGGGRSSSGGGSPGTPSFGDRGGTGGPSGPGRIITNPGGGAGASSGSARGAGGISLNQPTSSPAAGTASQFSGTRGDTGSNSLADRLAFNRQFGGGFFG